MEVKEDNQYSRTKIISAITHGFRLLIRRVEVAKTFILASLCLKIARQTKMLQ
jgi:hypothetical protein